MRFLAVANPHADATFVAEFLRTNDPIKACVAAGFLDPQYRAEDCAATVMARAEIAAAIQSGRALAVSRVKNGTYTVKRLQDDMEDVFQSSLKDGKYPAAIAAKRLQAELGRLLKQEIEVTHTHKVEDMTTDQLMRIVNKKPVTIEGESQEVQDE